MEALSALLITVVMETSGSLFYILFISITWLHTTSPFEAFLFQDADETYTHYYEV